MVSTCGSTSKSQHKCTSHFEDEWGKPASKLLDRPKIIHFMCDLLPLTDEHNQARQGLLGLEKVWLTKNPWFRLVTALLGMSLVDMHRWHKSREHANRFADGNQEEVNDIQIRQFADLLTKGLDKLPQFRKPKNAALPADEALTRIRFEDGTINRPPTAKEIAKGRNDGSPRQWNCMICRKHLREDGKVEYRKTTMMCAKCGMAICQVEHENRGLCLLEHQHSQDELTGCFGSNGTLVKAVFPKNKQLKCCQWAPNGGGEEVCQPVDDPDSDMEDMEDMEEVGATAGV